MPSAWVDCYLQGSDIQSPGRVYVAALHSCHPWRIWWLCMYLVCHYEHIDIWCTALDVGMKTQMPDRHTEVLWMYERTNKYIKILMDIWTDVWTYKKVCGWIDRCTDAWTYQQIMDMHTDVPMALQSSIYLPQRCYLSPHLKVRRFSLFKAYFLHQKTWKIVRKLLGCNWNECTLGIHIGGSGQDIMTHTCHLYWTCWSCTSNRRGNTTKVTKSTPESTNQASII